MILFSISSASFLRPLERVAADDAAVGAAVAQAADLLIDAVEVLRLAAGEHHDAAAVERALHHVLDALGQRGAVDLLVALLRGFQADHRGRRLHLDDVGAHQRGHLRRIGADVERGLRGAIEVAAARIAPHHDGEAGRLRLGGQFAQFLHLGEGVLAAGIDGEADRGAAETQRVLDAGGDRLVLVGGQRVGVVALQDGGDLPGERVGAGGDHAEWRGVGVQSGLDRELVVVVRIIGRRVRREAARGAVLEALIDRQDHHLAGAAQFAGGKDAGQVGLHPGRIALVPVQDLLHFLGDAHGDGPSC